MWKPLVVLAIVASSALVSESTTPILDTFVKCQKPNEIYHKCPNPCPPRECGINKALIYCAPTPKLGSKYCKPGCICADGFLRNKAGNCIPENDCKYDCAKNETLDSCYSDCPPRFCGVNIAAVTCLAINETECKPGCRCSDGYLRNGEGRCVLEKDCPTCVNQNEVYDVCPASCPSRRCDVDDRLILCGPQPKPGDPNCKPGCRCADGFAKNARGICIPRDQCPQNQCTGANETYNECPNPCPLQKCDVDPSVIKCAAPPKPGDPTCQPGCVCLDGYARNAEGKCILRDECPQNQCKGRANETYNACPNPCPLQKCDVDPRVIKCAAPPEPGDPLCQPGCVCVDGYARNDDGKCILRDECPQEQCKSLNETYNKCLNPCPLQKCDVDPNLIDCMAPPKPGDPNCVAGCECFDGYARNDDGKCIPRDQCPEEKCKALNERYNKCLNPCPLQRCDVDPRLIKCAAPPQPDDPKCVAGCECLDGQARNDDGICIPRDQCPQNCKRKQEIYSKCPAFVCRPQKCTEVGFPQPCLEPGPDSSCPVTPGCICQNGYVRNNDGDCIPIKQCPTCGGDPNATPGCGVNCGKRCSDRNKTEPAVCTLICKENGCDCREGYLLDDNTGMCVLPGDCTPTCGKDEVYSACTQGDCAPKTCSELGYPISCPRIDPKDCNKGCLCKEGYVRAENGTCIPKDQCPSGCGGDINARPGCGVNCGRYCSNYNSSKPVACPEICNLNGCDCKEGYVVDDNTGKCVLPSECSPRCGSNEVLSNCSNGGCGPWRCADVGNPTGCVKMDQKYCTLGCVCREGYVRDENERCILATECPSCGGDENAVAGCGVNCGRLCSNYKIADQISCIAVCYPNACNCKPGFVLDENTKKCVEPENCTPTCSNNEVFSDCVNGGCEPQYCSQLGQPVACVRPAQCKPGCKCAVGYVRDDNGKCIPKDQCPKNCKGQNEIYDPCPSTCPPQTCESIGKKYFCPLQPSNSTCYGACRCKPDYYRNKLGDCISKTNCLKCNGPNEFYSCGGACDNVCATLSKQNQTNCPIINIKCNEMCYCEEGYARDANNTCIPIENCPGICGSNERWDKCPARQCSPQSCKDLGFNKPCEFDENTPCPGPPGCVCDFNFVRDQNGKCIPKTDCPSCGGDPNAKSGCGLNCGRLCSNYDKGPVPCPRICFPNACDCKADYVFDENTGKCVLPQQCTPVCKENEVFSNCTNGGCDARNCSQLGQPVPCIKLDPESCIKGCVCAEGYLRAKNGTCVPVDQCGTPVCKENEVFSDCTNGGCEARNCSQLGQPVPCVKLDPESCIKGCVCAEGYLRANNGKCVPVDKCDNCNKPNEYYDSCAPSCPPQTCESIGRQYKCPITAAVCRGACRCEKGYYRNKKGECIREKDCLKCRGPHEYFSCGSACDNVCKTLNKQNQTNCPIKNIKCVEQCYCEEGYARDKDNNCIPISNCPKPTCGANEKLKNCPSSSCTPQKCSQLGFPIPCPGLTKYGCPEPPGCVCNDGYVRDSRGKCIPSNKCPSCGGDPNAVSGCGVNCQKTCSTYNRTDIVCLAICYPNACDCRKGYVLDENLGKCVRPEQCTPICGENEVFNSCANGGCGKWNCSQLGQPDLCIDPLVCKGGCNCKKGYLRAKNGTCVPIDQCPAPTCGKNERFEFCPDSICEPQKCSELGFPVPCAAKTGDTKCSAEPACVCNNGFVRNDKGICIPKEKCPSCGGDPNAKPGCGVNCGRLCSNYNKKSVPCPKICKLNGCDCKKDYVLDQNTGKCVLPKQCTPTCGKNEIYSKCVNGGCAAKNCSQLGRPVPCVKLDPKYCKKGCVCQPGYLRDSNGKCVAQEQCKEYCPGQNEVYDSCPPTCPPQTCESINKTFRCPKRKTDLADCKPACRCKEGYFRNKIGQCILKEDCLKCTGKNEFFSCGGACDNVCATLSEQNQTNCPIINIQCNRMCYCEEGYARNDKNICIPIDQCPPPTCGKNERLENCPDWLCTPQTCSQVGYPVACPAFQGESTVNQTCPGRPSCVCINGYVRSTSGKCIPVDQCPSCGGDPNAVQGCGVNCGRLCSNYKKKNVICPLFCKFNGCNCRKGYVYDSNTNKCVLPKNCTPTCGLNEVYDSCANGGCRKRNCTQIGEPTICRDPLTCVGGCVCQEGYLRLENGTCVAENQCPMKCKANEHFSCGPECDNECARLSTWNQTNCPIKNKRCVEKCYCDEGYARDDIKVCIPITQCNVSCNGDPNAVSGCGVNCGQRCSDYNKGVVACPLICMVDGCDCKPGYVYDDNLKKCVLPVNCSPVCPNNEVLDKCANEGSKKRKCSELTDPVTCKNPAECIAECVCIEGYLRNETGVCVPESECNPECPKPNEVYNSCPSTCPPQTCESLQKDYDCPNEQNRSCEPACICADGFFRNKIGECITKDQCAQCSKPNEYYSCGGACDNVCLTLNEQSKDDCPIINIQCNKMCYCEDGYARNESNICIPIEDCPPPRCRDDERWEENPCQVCDPLTCSEVGKTKECPPVQDDGCDNTPTCVCKAGLVRDNGDCIPSSNCFT